eukprot:TRINITY_DN3773_c0_g1_i1.p1 TRINITY_DN3773_c0_g1~~TRINITY_DN3773_c0_g1_i1.p1  ORF type:complete len:587 (-),score=168.11 TRINITY_DN3773_c0_g1_i1:831-2591(-)
MSCSSLTFPPDEGDEAASNHRASFVLEAVPEEERLLQAESLLVSEEMSVVLSPEGSEILSVAEDPLTPLSSKQQVALWLTHSSLTNLSSMPSIKSLVSRRCPLKRVPGKKAPKPMERNDSTKSLSQPFRHNLLEEIPMRKCETVLTLASVQGLTHNSGLLKTQSSSHAQISRSNPGKKFSWLRKLSQSSGSSLKPAQVPLYSGRNSETSRPPSMVGCESPSQGLRPVNRLRSKSSIMCSRCTSVLSMNTSRMTSRAPSQMSLLYFRGPNELKTVFICKICLCDYPSPKDMVRLEHCGCSSYCRDCIVQYLTFEILEGAYEISCPDAECEKEGVIAPEEIEKIIGRELFDKHMAYRLNAEVAMDPNRAWCPSAGCDTICHICRTPKQQEESVPVKCPTCDKEFCSMCSSAWHPNLTCRENGARLVRVGGLSEVAGPSWILDDPEGNIKQCPTCKVPIERNAGCAQMMCKRCKHVFCWYCQTSLDDDFLLRHYDSGQCKGKLGHSRASVLWHRAQVIAILAGFGVFLLVASPLLLIVAPCILCCKCKFFKRLGEQQQQGGNNSSPPQPTASSLKSTSIAFEEEPALTP